jgi:hypothetical protein
MGDVFEFLVDGTSGLSPGGVEGMCIVAGVCSIGTVGKGYLLGKSSDLEALLGHGPLVDRLRDLFATGGQNPIVIAVPVTGSAGGYVSDVVHTGDGPEGETSGNPAENADVVVEIADGGALGTATAKVSEDGGETFGSADTVAENGQITIGDTGAILSLEEGTHVPGDQYVFSVRVAIGPVVHTGTGSPVVTASGSVAMAADLTLKVVSGGALNEATYQLSLDGDVFGPVRTVPASGEIGAGDTGVTLTVSSASDLVAGDTYACRLLPPVPSISAVMDAIEEPLGLYDVEFVYVVGPSDAVDWAAMGAQADVLWNAHRPTFFLAETRLPYAGETLDDWTAAMVAERQEYAHRFVAVCCAFGEVSDSTGTRLLRNWAGLAAGRILSIPVMRAIGRVRDGGVSQGTLPSGYTDSMQQILEQEGYITAKNYAGLYAPYFGDAKTLADVTSDYQYLEVLRVVFKAVRKARIAALKSMHDEVGDPVAEGGASGLNYLQANIEMALDTLVGAVPKEMAGYVVTIPPGQDIVNNGVAVEMELIGIPIIRTVKLFANYVYAGSRVDPRLQ